MKKIGMRQRVLFCSLLIFCNLQSSFVETNLFSLLPKEVIFHIFNFIPYKTGYKDVMMCHSLYQFVFDYLLDRQNSLLLKKDVSEKEKKCILYNNRVLLSQLVTVNNGLKNSEGVLRTWDHGELKYFLTDSNKSLFYVLKDTESKLYRVVLTEGEESILHGGKVDFLEWHKNNLRVERGVIPNFFGFENLPRVCVLKFEDQSTRAIDLNLDFTNLFLYTPDVRLFFMSKKCIVTLSANFNKFSITSPINAIYFSIPGLQRREGKKSLSLCFMIDQFSEEKHFNDIRSLKYLDKCTLDFCGDLQPNDKINIVMPSDLQTLVLKNCPFTISIPDTLKNVTIKSPRRGCAFSIFNANISLDDSSQLHFEKNIEKIHIEGDQDGVLQDILHRLKIEKFDQAVIKNCS